MKILITLGPTREKIDAVRFISNESSGKMGAAIAEEAVKRGYETTVIAGPVSVKLPKTKTIYVESASQMISETLRELRRGYDVFISAAAIADYTPLKTEKKKIKSDRRILTLKLKATPKLTAKARKKFPDLFIVAFKAETEKRRLISEATTKLREEKLDLVCANHIREGVLGGDYNEVVVVDKRGDKTFLAWKTKKKLAEEIMNKIEEEYRKK